MSNDTRARLLESAAELMAASPEETVSLRSICDRVGVQLPTLYHFFGSRQGLEDAVTAFVYDRFLGEHPLADGTRDPVGTLRAWWDAQVRFGLENPVFHGLMYRGRDGQLSPAATDAYERILNLCTIAAASGVLQVDPRRAADHLSATCLGSVALLIVRQDVDQALSAAIREGVLAAITSVAAAPTAGDSAIETHTRSLLAALATGRVPASLRPEELALLTLWLSRLAAENAVAKATPSLPSVSRAMATAHAH